VRPTAIERAQELAEQAEGQRRLGERIAALKSLRSALPSLEAELADGNDAAAAQLADIHGQIGGALREGDRLIEAAAAYDEGYGYEARYELSSTYNALNRVVTRILLCPQAMSNPAALGRYAQLPWLDVLAELTRLHDVVARRDQGDMWAVGDLALTAVLTGANPGDALDRLANEAGPYVRDAHRRIVARLAKLDTPRRAELERMLRILE